MRCWRVLPAIGCIMAMSDVAVRQRVGDHDSNTRKPALARRAEGELPSPIEILHARRDRPERYAGESAKEIMVVEVEVASRRDCRMRHPG